MLALNISLKSFAFFQETALVLRLHGAKFSVVLFPLFHQLVNHYTQED